MTPPTDATPERMPPADERRPSRVRDGRPERRRARSPPDGARTSARRDGGGSAGPTDARRRRGGPAAARSPNASPRPGLHLIAEIKRSSPSAGQIAAGDEDIVARARAYEAGGAAAISVLCEPHWFGGSVDDLRAVRAAVAVPVLAKDFVVEEIQLPHAPRGRRGRWSSCSPSSIRRSGSPGSSTRALEIGLEPLVEAHDARELERALATDARLIGINNRDLRTLDVDVERAEPPARARPGRPARHRRVRRPRPRDRRRAGGRSGSMARSSARRSCARPTRPPPLGRSSPPGARRTIRPTWRAGHGQDLRHHRRRRGRSRPSRAGADAIGLNVVAGTPRELALDEAAALARVARSPAGRGRPSRRDHRRCRARSPPRDRRRGRSRRRPAQRRRSRSTTSPRSVAPDLEGPPPPGRGPGRRASERLARSSRAAAPGSTAGADAAPPRYRRRAAPGRHRHAASERPRRGGRPRAADHPGRRPRSGQRCRRAPRRPGRRRRRRVRHGSGRASRASGRDKDPVRVALFVKRARAARDDRPNVAVPARRPSTPASSTPTAPAGGGWSAISAAGTSPRR